MVITKEWFVKKGACKGLIEKFQNEKLISMSGMDVWEIIEILREQKDSNGYIVWLFVKCKLTGVCECWHKNGQQEYKHNYVNGQMHGLCEGWYENGQLMYKENYGNGKLHGLSEWWDENGQFWYKHNYVRGVFQKVSESKSEFNGVKNTELFCLNHTSLKGLET